MPWSEEAARVASDLWRVGKNARETADALQPLYPGVGRVAVISKMRRMGIPGGSRIPGGSKRISTALRKGHRLVGAHREPQGAFNPIPLVDAGDEQCHRVIGPVVWRGVSMVCGKPLDLLYMKFCPDCKKELGIAFR